MKRKRWLKKVRIYLQRHFLLVISYCLIAFLYLSSIHNRVGEFIGVHLTHPLLFKAREYLDKSPKQSDRIKIYAIDDKTLKEFNKQDLTLKEWLVLLRGIASKQPAAIYIDKVFGTPIFDMDPQEFIRGIHSLGVPVVTDIFSPLIQLPDRRQVPLKEGSLSRLIDRGAIDLSQETLEDYDFLKIFPSYLYGAHNAIVDAFQYNGFVNYNGDGYVKLFHRIKRDAITTHFAISGIDDIFLDNQKLYVDGESVEIDYKARTLVNFINPKNLRVYSLYPIFNLAKRGKAERIKVKEGQHVMILPVLFTGGGSDFHASPVGYIPGGYVITAVLNSVLTGKWLNPLGMTIPIFFVIGFLAHILGRRLRWHLWILGSSLMVSLIITFGFVLFIEYSYQTPLFIHSAAFLLFSLASFTSGWFHRYRKARDETIKRQSMHQAAQLVQESLIPDMSSLTGVEIATHYKAADATGGDWFGVYESRSKRYLYVFIGDVTGHGFSSALVTGTVAGAIKAKVDELDSEPLAIEDAIVRFAHNVNYVVYQSGAKANRLMTMAFMVIDRQKMQGVYLNAGHCSVLIYSNKKVQSLIGGGAILGFYRDLQYEIKDFELSEGARIFCYTDGLIENTGPNGELLKTRQVRKIFTNLELSCEEVNQEILKKAEGIWQDHPPNDDCTFFTIGIERYVDPRQVMNPTG